MKKFYFLRICFFIFLTRIYAEESPNTECLEKEKSLTLLQMAENLMTKAGVSFSPCSKDVNPLDDAGCNRNLDSLAYIELSNKLLSDIKIGFPNCRPKHEKPMDCAELMENGVKSSGIYTIYPRSRAVTRESIQVYCDMETDGGGWTMIQRRGQYGNGEYYFNKNWNEYKAGFGDLQGEFWLGNDNIFSITNHAPCSVRMVMKHENGKWSFYQYKNFWIDGEDNFYLLRLSEGSGPAGNAIGNHDGWRFYTKDKPDFTRIGIRSGGWWRNGIGTSSLNGLNLYKTGRERSRDGINWQNFGGSENSFEYTEIKVRPKKFITKGRHDF